jgi:DNA polymerase III epsilon subunit-like protein/ADP-ribose pyrophosphatase YjhB (NUDIX family)
MAKYSKTPKQQAAIAIAKKKTKVKALSVAEQNERIFEAGFDLVRSANDKFSGSRTITRRAAKSVMSRCLSKNEDQTYSMRRMRTLRELNNYIQLAQNNKVFSSTPDNTDLLPISHPRSTRKHNFTTAEVMKHRARWIIDDPRIQDDSIRAVLSSALTCHPASAEYEYSIARLQSLPQGSVPSYALLAALGDGNSSAARSARAMRQRRDRKGRFAEMGGGLRALIRRATGAIQSLTGRAVATDSASDTFDMELPDGTLVRIPAKSAEGVKAILKSAQGPDGYSKTPAKAKTGDPVVEESDLVKIDAPSGFTKDENWSPSETDTNYYGTKIDLGTKYTDDAYDVIKISTPNAAAKDKFEAAQQREGEGQNVVTEGAGKNGSLDPNLPVYFVSRRGEDENRPFAVAQRWSDIQDYIAQDEPKFEKNELPNPEKMADDDQEEETGTPTATPAEGLEGELIPKSSGKNLKKDQKKYQKALKDYEAKGGKYPLDPAKDHMVLPDGTVVDAETGEVVRNADGTSAKDVAPKAPAATSEIPEGYYNVDRDDYTPEGPVDGQEASDFTDDPAELAQKFETPDLKKALEDGVKGTKKFPATGYGTLTFEDGDEIVPAEAIYNALKEQGEDADAMLDEIYGKPSGDATPEVSEDVKAELGKDLEAAPDATSGDVTTLPALLDGLSDEEKDNYAKTGEYAQYLPKNDSFDVPTDYSELSTDAFDKDQYVLPEDAPEGFNYDPVDIASFYNTEDLKGELRRALEPGNEMPGYGMLSTETDEGEEYVAYVPGEAIRDALQLQGEDTNALTKEIYDEGFAGQEEDALTPEQINDALEGEAPEAQPEAPEAEQAPTETTEQAPSDEKGPEAVDGVNVGEPTGPAKLKAKTTELKAGDVTTNDFFTIESVEPSEIPGKSWVTGYYPGHVSQKTKLWNNDTDISVFRNVDAPTKGDLPVLSKPKAKEYDPEGKVYKDKELDLWVPKDAEARSKYLDAVDQYNSDLAQAKEMWSAPEGVEEWVTESEAPIYTPSNPVGVVEVAATEVKAGDIAFKKEGKNDFYEYFIVQDVAVDENGNAVLTGFYPDHQSQSKSWKGTTPIKVIRGASALPEPGKKPALERPKKDDPAYKEKYAEFNAAKKASAATFTPPLNVDALPPEPKKVPRPTPPAFMGDKLKAIAAEANGDPVKFKELLANEEVIHLDFESTGGFTAPSPIQVSMTKVKNGEIIEEKTLFMNPEQPLDSFYTDKDPSQVLKDSDGNPISDEFLSKQMSQADAFKEISDFLGADPIVSAHNMPFDGEILRRKMAEYGLDYKPAGEIDTLSLARKVINGSAGDHKLEAVANRYGLAEPNTDWHDASVDVAVLPGILNNLLDEMAVTKSGIDVLDLEKSSADYDKAKAEYDAYKSGKSKADSELVMAKTFADGMAGKEIPEADALVKAMPKDKPTSDELSSATTPSANEVGDGDFQIESVLGGNISNNWISDPENTTNVGAIAVEEWQPGDFIKAKHDGFHEIISITPIEGDDKRVLVKRRLLANGKEYESAWVKYQAYEVWRRNSEPEAVPAPEPELEQPQLEIDEAPEKEANAGKWNDYTIAEGTDGVFYAENISGADVQALKAGTLTPPKLPFFAPLGGGNNQETGEGYFFTTDGKRFWGKYGAAGAMLRRKNADGEYEYFLAKRSSSLSQGGGKWGIPGGAHKDQTIAKAPNATAKEEFMEEVGGDISALEPIYVDTNKVGAEWAYETSVFEVGPDQYNDLTSKDGENTATGWFTGDQINKMSDAGMLHSDFADSFPNIISNLEDEDAKTDKPTPEAEVNVEDIEATFDTSNWKKTGTQAGSNQGAFYTDPDTGNQYYVKKPKSDKHFANEILGGALYEEAGVKFGRAYKGIDKNGNSVLVSPLVEGSDADFADKKSNADVKSTTQSDFAVDAWLGNYDVIGLEYDNVLTDKDGNVTRIDAGGSLLFRAQGGTDKEFGPEATQVDSMRDSKQNPQAAEIFGDMTDEQIAESVKKVQAVSEEKIDELVDAAFPDDADTAEQLKTTLKARRQYLIDRFLGGQPAEEAPETPEKPSVDSNTTVLDVAGDLEAQLADAQAAGKKVAFKYNGKERVVTPKGVWKNPQNGNINLSAIGEDGVKKNYTLSKFEQSGSTASEAPEAAPTPEKELPQAPEAAQIDPAEKQKVLDEVSALAEKLFGNQGKTKDLLESLKGQDGANTDLIDSILEDIKVKESVAGPDATPEEKIQSDLSQALTPDEDAAPEDEVPPIDPVALAEELKTPLTPDLIWAKVKDEKGISIIENGDIVVAENVTPSGSTIYTMVKRNSDNTFSVYHRIKSNDGSTRVKTLAGRWHSYTALSSRIESEKWKAKITPSKVISKSKPETPGTIAPSALPTQKGSYVSADGKTPIKVGMVVKDTKTGKTGKVVSLKDEFVTGKSKSNPAGYTYTDVAKVKWDDSGVKAWKPSTYLEIQDTSGVKPDEPEGPTDGGNGGGGTPPTPKTPDSPAPAAVPTTSVDLPTYEGTDLAGATAIADVESKAVAKNSVGHLAAYGANDYSDYKNFLSGEFLKDPNSKNMVPGILVQNADPNDSDQDLTSYGVVSKQDAKAKEVYVSFFDGPLAGQTKTFSPDKIWSREKFITPEQAKELDITLDPTLFDKSKTAAKAKGEAYAKKQAEAAKKAQQAAEAKALKDKFSVNGPGFSVQTLDAAPDYSKSPHPEVPSLEDSLKMAKNDNPAEAANGSTTLLDSDSIEDLEVHVGMVTDEKGEKKLRLQFTLTNWAGKQVAAKADSDSNISKSKALRLGKWEKQQDGSLVWKDVWDTSTVDSNKNGVTFEGPAGKGTFLLHRASKSIDDTDVDFFKYHSSSPYAVSFHNKAEIYLPADATSEDVAEALNSLGGISQVRPALESDVRGVIENKMIWLLGSSTDGKKNYAGELREKTLQIIKDEYGFTADDVEVVVDPLARGRVNYYMPESAVDKLMEKTGFSPFIVHQWKGGDQTNSVDWFYNMITSGGIYATATRWMNGINKSGMSSSSDIDANGGNYVFASPSSKGSSTSTNLAFYFNSKNVLRRLDYYKNNSDKYGQLQSDSEDIVQSLSNSYGELMFKKNLSWADLSSISMPAAIREKLIERLMSEGLTDLADIVSGKKKKKGAKK